MMTGKDSFSLGLVRKLSSPNRSVVRVDWCENGFLHIIQHSNNEQGPILGGILFLTYVCWCWSRVTGYNMFSSRKIRM